MYLLKLLLEFFYLQKFPEAWELLNAIDLVLKKSLAQSRELLNAHLQILSRCVQNELCMLHCEHFFETGLFLSREASRVGAAPAAYAECAAARQTASCSRAL